MPYDTRNTLSNPQARQEPLEASSWGIFFRIAAAGASLFATSEVLQYITRDQNYNDVVSLITKEVNHAHCLAEQKKRNTLEVSCDVYAPKVYSEPRVKTILNTYIQVVLDSTYPEYDAQRLNEAASTIAEVTKRSGENGETGVRSVLGQLYWSTEQGRVHDTSFIRPRTARNNAHYRQTPEQYRADDKGFFEKVSDNLETIGTVIIIAAVAYLGITIYNDTKTTAEA